MNVPEEMEFFNQFVEKGLLERLIKCCKLLTFKRLPYTEAIELLQKSVTQDLSIPVEWGCDLQTEHERYLTEEIFKRASFRN